VKRFALVAIAVFVCYAQTAQKTAPQPILEYIRQSWSVLTRSNRDIAKAAPDPKFRPGEGGRWPVYVARDENIQSIEQRLKAAIAPREFATIQLRALPEDSASIRDQGLLYLPFPYVVPGGRFNEMYGWDSFFIQLGLLHDGEAELAKNMADNFLYQVREYGKVLNANRTYYLGRSQPPFLTAMLLGVYRKTNDRKWLADAEPLAENYYRFWTTGPHQVADTGLSRYFDSGVGPAPEVVYAERDAQGRTHYELVKEYLRTHDVTDYDVSQYYDRAKNELTPLFYKGDRSMRESGFDPSNRFGTFNLDVIHYNPVCLNTLLYVMEMQTAEILDAIGRGAESGAWRDKAKTRADRINRLMWDAKDGLYYDYDFVHQRVRRYPFLATFFPLWAGIASKEQAARVVANLPKFERAGGLQTSAYYSGNQWDAPFGWAPLEWIAVEGLRRYGYKEDADRIAMKFLSLVEGEYEKSATIVEKYDVVERSSRVSSGIQFGYRSNETGFGWTNAVFTTLLDELGPEARKHVLAGAPR
jgi:alpha,alpha-trehalase